MIAPSVSADLPLLEYHAQFYERIKLAGKSPNTRRIYRGTIRQFEKHLGRTPLLSDLDDETVAVFMAWTTGQGRSPATANRHRNALVALWRFAARKRHVEEFPDVDSLQEFKRVPVAYTGEQMGRLLAVAPNPKPIAGIPSRLWWSALLLLIYDTGIRIGAALKLECADFDRDSRKLLIRAEIQKQRADQMLLVSEETAAVLAKCIAVRERDRLFPLDVCMCTVYFRLSGMLKRAGLPHGRRDKFHKIRRTCATMVELHGGRGSAMVQLGHSNPRVTEAYIDLSALPEFRVIEQVPRPITEGAEGRMPDPSQQCAHCGNSFLPYKASQLYCSEHCQETVNRKRRRQENPPTSAARPEPRACKFCGNVFQPERRADAMFCAKKCRNADYRAKGGVA